MKKTESKTNNNGLVISVGNKYRNFEISTRNSYIVKVLNFDSDSSVWAINCSNCKKGICNSDSCYFPEIPVSINRLFHINAVSCRIENNEKNKNG